MGQFVAQKDHQRFLRPVPSPNSLDRSCRCLSCINFIFLSTRPADEDSAVSLPCETAVGGWIHSQGRIKTEAVGKCTEIKNEKGSTEENYHFNQFLFYVKQTAREENLPRGTRAKLRISFRANSNRAGEKPEPCWCFLASGLLFPSCEAPRQSQLHLLIQPKPDETRELHHPTTAESRTIEPPWLTNLPESVQRSHRSNT